MESARRTTMWMCDRIFIHIHIHFFYSLTHKPILVDMRKRIQDKYTLQGSLYPTRVCIFCHLHMLFLYFSLAQALT